jgi:hypothetical protein
MLPYTVFVSTHHQQYIVAPAQRQAVALNQTRWHPKQRLFFFVCLPDYDLLQFSIKTYPSQKNLATHFQQLNEDDEANLLDVFGCIRYEGEGVYIQGNASVLPLISIFRYTYAKTPHCDPQGVIADRSNDDILLEQEFKKILSASNINIASDSKVHVHGKGHIAEYMIHAKQGGARQILCSCQQPSLIKPFTKSPDQL